MQVLYASPVANYLKLEVHLLLCHLFLSKYIQIHDTIKHKLCSLKPQLKGAKPKKKKKKGYYDYTTYKPKENYLFLMQRFASINA